jgi:hypothetical protein
LAPIGSITLRTNLGEAVKAEVARRRRGTALRATVAGLAAAGIVLVAGIVVLPTPAASADDSSAVTVKARDQDPDAANAPFPDLEVTVSQTTDLVDQGISVSWKGGKKSAFPDSASGGKDFVQIMQCWKDDANGGPDRTSCQYGGTLGAAATRDNYRSAGSIAEQDEAYTAPPNGLLGAYTSIPFVSATGKTVANVVDGKLANASVDVNTNEFFTRYTTNEIPWAGSGGDGSGNVNFEVQSALNAPGLGCGSPVGAGADVKGQSCWLVIVPRGSADAGEQNVVNSALFWDAWKHRIAVKLDFRPLGVRCEVGAAERQVIGSEVISHAVSSWQPSLCGVAGGSIYTMLTGTESDSLAQANSTLPEAPLALASRSLGDADIDELQYAPVALSGVAVGFSLDRAPLTTAPAEIAARARLRFDSLKLTPRLVAKLLTYSYRDSLPQRADLSHIGYVDAANPGKNARNITRDPDFLAVNDPEWAQQGLNSTALADLLIPQGRSDAAWAVWQYVLADADARRFLAGVPDQWGMIVNPWYSTNADHNPSGTAFSVPRDTFPKADPVESPQLGDTPPVNLVTWRPYTNDLTAGASLTLRGDGQVLGSWDTNSIPPKFTRNARDLPGVQKVVGLTDTASAERYQVLTAELLNPAGEFVAPTTDSIAAAAAAMTRDPAQPQVIGFDPASSEAKAATTAYPLTLPVYAAARADIADPELRQDYAEFIRYAVSGGQEPGEAQGQLPDGYAPLPESWRQRALEVATTIAAGPAPVPSPADPSDGSVPAPTLPAQTSTGSTATAASSAPAAATDQPAATGAPTTVLAGPPTAADGDLGAYPALIPATALAGAAAGGLSLFFSRRRLLR